MAGADWCSFWISQTNRFNSSVLNVAGYMFSLDKGSFSVGDVSLYSGEMFYKEHTIDVHQGDFATVVVVDSTFVGVNFYKYLTLLDCIKLRYPEKMARFPYWWDDPNTQVMQSSTVLFFFGDDEKYEEIDFSEDKIELYVGFDREIKADVYKLISESRLYPEEIHKFFQILSEDQKDV